MLNNDLKLNAKMFDEDVELVPLRNGFGEGLVVAGEVDENVVGLCADLTESTRMKAFADKYPDRFVQVGVAEQNLAATASGMAAMGKIPFITSYAMFSPGRNWEQIRTTICYNNQPVKIIGSHAGVSVGPDGGTHQAIEDMAITRVIPRMVVLAPCDSHEARKATISAAKNGTPVYIRLAREKTPVMTTSDTPFEIGKAQIFWKGDNPQVTIISCGALTHKALVVAKDLKGEGIEVTVINNHTIKPLDTETILESIRESGAVVTVEEHQRAGGLGSVISELLGENFPVPIERIGVDDKFGQSGKPEELIEEYGLGVSNIKKAVQRVIKRRKIYMVK
jgi:transketolase